MDKRRNTLLIVGVVVFIAALLSGCSSSDKTGTTATATPAPISSGAPVGKESTVAVTPDASGQPVKVQETAAPTPSASASARVEVEVLANPPVVEVADIQTGMTKMNDLVKSFKQAVESKNAAEVQELSGQMVGVWAKIEANIKAVNPQLHGTLQEAMIKLTKLARSDKPSQEKLVELSYTLYQQFRDARKQLQVK